MSIQDADMVHGFEGRMPKQGRSRASFERMLDAAEHLLMLHRGDGFTLNEVSEVAGIAVGSIAFRFGGKDLLVRTTLVRALQRIMHDEIQMIDRVREEAWNLDSLVVNYVSDFAEFLRSNGPLMREVMRRASHDPDLARLGQQAVVQGARLAQELFLERRSDMGGTRPEAKVRTAFHIIFSTLSRQLGINILGEPAFFQDLEDLKQELAWMALSYLKSPY